jgi:23S rRNA pseudouridine2605 synthase
MESIVAGITLEDGFIVADSVAYADSKDKTVVGIEIHSGRNRIVRRIFEHLGYDVKNLDRVMFANLTKKNVERGKFRFLNEKEVRLLKFMNKSFVRKSALTQGNEDTFE